MYGLWGMGKRDGYLDVIKLLTLNVMSLTKTEKERRADVRRLIKFDSAEDYQNWMKEAYEVRVKKFTLKDWKWFEEDQTLLTIPEFYTKDGSREKYHKWINDQFQSKIKKLNAFKKDKGNKKTN